MRVTSVAIFCAFASLSICCPKSDADPLFFGQVNGNPVTTGAPSMVAPNNLMGQAMAVAQQPRNQAVASRVFCYCGCDREHGHKSLMDCYRTGHVPGCVTCQQEFVRVGQMNKQGDSVAQIQHDIDNQFSHRYPYPQPSPILQQYLSTRDSAGEM